TLPLVGLLMPTSAKLRAGCVYHQRRLPRLHYGRSDRLVLARAGGGAAGRRSARRAARVVHAALHLSAPADLPITPDVRARADPGRKRPRALRPDRQGCGAAAAAAGRDRAGRASLSALSALPGRPRLLGRRRRVAILASDA